MGNQHSRSSSTTSPSSKPASPTANNVTTSHGHAHHERERERVHHPPHSQFHSARRRESIQALSTAKAPAAPSVSLENAESHPTSARPLSRGRAQTVGTSTRAVTSQLRAAQEHYNNHHSHNPPYSDAAMGNEQSTHNKNKEPAREKIPRALTPPQRPSTTSNTTTPFSAPIAEAVQQPVSEPEPEPQRAPSPSPPIDAPTLPVDVPQGLRDELPERLCSIDPADASQDYIPSSQFSRPPRLPLPIEEEVHTPGSPIISAQEIWSPIQDSDAEGMLPRRSSMLSTTTADDDDLGEEFKTPSTGRPTVPTLIEWEGPGERVYVTGTFAGWNRKYKLHRNGPSKNPDALSAYVSVTPGTHHLTFLVDNDMRTSDKLPTAVDYTNILVNYIEVPYPEPPALATSPSKDMTNTLDAPTPVQERDAALYPPQVPPPAPQVQPTIKAPLPEPAKPVKPEPTKRYHQNIPRYLIDLDAPEESSRYARANAMTNNLPTPPSLPGFLGKSILNGTTPMKDDSSVLIHPNHTVLNHLATSSIKDNILATSATTRYKQKFLTTIMYKPKEEHGANY
ncbi:MSS4 Phosphatidylinositol-4-phosphate 5-kinase [Pyrenophora teres f. maculata]|nr:MSS4 Phosphatidylinositol-4-phosphate 5-kinase [Pyrenophora teres f. maculata]